MGLRVRARRVWLAQQTLERQLRVQESQVPGDYLLGAVQHKAFSVPPFPVVQLLLQPPDLFLQTLDQIILSLSLAISDYHELIIVCLERPVSLFQLALFQTQGFQLVRQHPLLLCQTATVFELVLQLHVRLFLSDHQGPQSEMHYFHVLVHEMAVLRHHLVQFTQHLSETLVE